MTDNLIFLKQRRPIAQEKSLQWIFVLDSSHVLQVASLSAKFRKKIHLKPVGRFSNICLPEQKELGIAFQMNFQSLYTFHVTLAFLL